MIIETPSRLHLTLIDLNGIHGRIDGGVGLTIKEPSLRIEAEKIDEGIETISLNPDTVIDTWLYLSEHLSK